MKLSLTKHFLTVQREPGDKAVRGGSWGRADTAFFGRLAKSVNAARLFPVEVIRVRMSRDGHLYGDDVLPYLRGRRTRRDAMPYPWIYDGSYAVRDAAADFNRGEAVTLCVEQGEQ